MDGERVERKIEILSNNWKLKRERVGLGTKWSHLAVCAAWFSLLPRCPSEKMRKNGLRGLDNVQQGSRGVNSRLLHPSHARSYLVVNH